VSDCTCTPIRAGDGYPFGGGYTWDVACPIHGSGVLLEPPVAPAAPEGGRPLEEKDRPRFTLAELTEACDLAAERGAQNEREGRLPAAADAGRPAPEGGRPPETCEWPNCQQPALCRSGNFGDRLVCRVHFQITNGQPSADAGRPAFRALVMALPAFEDIGGLVQVVGAKADEPDIFVSRDAVLALLGPADGSGT